jgi:hypothetical protein
MAATRNPARMPPGFPLKPIHAEKRPIAARDWPFLLSSIALQLALGLFFGHIYDIRIFMATGYLVATGQNPYISQDLTSIFHNSSFQAITTVGYPPPWPLVLGLVYRISFTLSSNFLAYNLAIKIPMIAANIGLAYLVARVLRRMGAPEAARRRAWIFMLLNPFVLYVSAAWGQFDSIVALLALASLVLLDSGKLKSSAILLALAVAFKPTAMPLLVVPFLYLRKEAPRRRIIYYAVLAAGLLLFCVAPFPLFGWNPSPILMHWNAHFVVGGGLSWLTFLELTQSSYQLPGDWWLVGLLWVPALALAGLAMRNGISGFQDLLRKSAAVIMVFFLARAWLSEPNLMLILPLVLILWCVGDLDRMTLNGLWMLPLIFSFFNVSTAQLFFPSMPNIMNDMLKQMDNFRTARLIAKVLIVIPWEILGWSIVVRCLRAVPSARGGRCSAIAKAANA